MQTKMRRCNICKDEKNTNEFYTKYARCKKCHDTINKMYYEKNKSRINENNRASARKRKGLPAKNKTFSFYRDVISNLNINDKMWNKLLKLPLTKKQRKIVELSKLYNQTEVAKILGVKQVTLNKHWNGRYDYEYEKYLGGVYAKAKKAGII